jgi:4-amino-4-deoxy-L-arabinose transferase
VGAGLILIALVAALIAVPGMRDTVTLWKWMIAAAGLVLWITSCRAGIVRQDVHAKLAFYCAGPVLFMFSWHFIFAAALTPRKAPGEFILSQASSLSGKSILVVESRFVGAVCWFCKRDNVFLTGRTGEYTYGLSFEDSQSRVLDVEQIKDLILGHARTEPVILVLGAKYYAQSEGQLPKPRRVERREGLVWAEYSCACQVAAGPPYSD